jgi:membrane protein required for beta-lactamase induction
MKLIAILLSLLIEHFVDWLPGWRKLDWFYSYSAWWYGKLEGHESRNGPVGLIIILGTLMVVVWLAWAILNNIGGVLGFLFGVVVLLYCFGPGDLVTDVNRYLDAERQGNQEEARGLAGEVVTGDVPVVAEERAHAVKSAVFVSLNQRILAVIFWFLLLGPIGAALYRAAWLSKHNVSDLGEGYKSAASKLVAILDWPSARLCVLAYALAGHFADTMMQFKSFDDFMRRDSDELLIAAGSGAIQMDLDKALEPGKPDLDGVAEALGLAKRSFVVWIGVIAALTIAGWVV